MTNVREPRQRLALMLIAQTIDALRQGTFDEVEAFEAVDTAINNSLVKDEATLARSVELMRKHGFEPNLGKAGQS